MAVMQLKQEVEAICDYGWDVKHLSSYLDVGIGTINDLLHRKKRQETSSRSKTIRIIYFRKFLEKISESGTFPTPELVVSIPVMDGRDFSSFIKEFYSANEEVVIHIINQSVEKFASNRLDIDYIQIFKDKFGGAVNEETITKAAIEDPQFLADFITLGRIKNFTKALAVSKLGLSHNENFLGLLRTLTKNPTPLVREGSYKALSEYFLEDEEKYSFLLPFFKKSLKYETGPGVKRQIASLIELMEMYE